jgi:hypothetical protein
LILSARRLKVQRLKDDMDISKLAVTYRDFKRNVFALKNQNTRIRAMYDEYSEIELIAKDIDKIIE